MVSLPEPSSPVPRGDMARAPGPAEPCAITLTRRCQPVGAFLNPWGSVAWVRTGAPRRHHRCPVSPTLTPTVLAKHGRPRVPERGSEARRVPATFSKAVRAVGSEPEPELAWVPCKSDFPCVSARFYVVIMVTRRHLPHAPLCARLPTTTQSQEVTPNEHLRVRKGLPFISGYTCRAGIWGHFRAPESNAISEDGTMKPALEKTSLRRRFGPRKSLFSSALYRQFMCPVSITK